MCHSLCTVYSHVYIYYPQPQSSEVWVKYIPRLRLGIYLTTNFLRLRSRVVYTVNIPWGYGIYILNNGFVQLQIWPHPILVIQKHKQVAVYMWPQAMRKDITCNTNHDKCPMIPKLLSIIVRVVVSIILLILYQCYNHKHRVYYTTVTWYIQHAAHYKESPKWPLFS